MRHFWSYFVFGAGLLLIISMIRKPIAVAEGDPRLKTVQDPQMTLMKKDAPGASEVDAGLKRRETELKQREEELAAWELRLGTEESRLKLQLEELRSLQDRHQAMIEADKRRRERITAELIKTYETMSPKKAAQVFTMMDQELAADFLMAMKPKKVAAILDVMDTDKAAELSSKIAGRRKPASSANVGSQAQGR